MKHFILFILALFLIPIASAETETVPDDFYRQIGMPDPSKAWAPFDYLQAATSLNPLAQQKPQYLPHYEDPQGKPYIEHMSDGTNLYQILQYANTHEQRMELILLYLDGIQRLFSIYQQALNEGVTYYDEWVDLIALSSYLAALSRAEWEYFLQTQESGLSAEELDKKFEAVTVLQTALINPVIIGLQAIPNLSVLSADRLIQKLNYSMPSYAAQLPLSTQKKLQQAIEQAYSHVTDQEVRINLLKLASFSSNSKSNSLLY